jgi:splicing factor 3A subunit 1
MAVATMSMPDLNVHMNGNGYPNGNGDVEMGSADVSVRFSTGLILPPPEIKCTRLLLPKLGFNYHTNISITAVIDKTASWVAKSANPPQFEDKIRETQRNDPKFSFLNPADPYHAYYRHRLQRVAAGEVDEPTATEDAKDTAVVTEEAPKDFGVEPPVPEFILELPTITPQDL